MESPQISKFESKISPSILPIIVILAAIVFISGLLHVLIRNLLEQSNGHEDDQSDIHNQSRNVTAFQGRLQQLFHLHDSGVDQSFIDCLPVFLYSSIVGPKVDPFDCAVCLCELEPDDKLRLIPVCSHAFHVDCIDTWLLSHSTCPLCRSSILDSPAAAATESGGSSSSSLSDNNTNSIVCDDKLGENSAEDRVVQVKLGKFRNADVGGVLEGGGDRKLDRRRCFSLGSYEYVMSETALLRVAVDKQSKSLEPRKKESFSVSKIWLRSARKKGTGTGRVRGARSVMISSRGSLRKSGGWEVRRKWILKLVWSLRLARHHHLQGGH